MSIANVFIQQFSSGKAPPGLKKDLIGELSNWKDRTTPLCSMGVLFDGSVRDEYLRDIEELVREQVSDEKCTTETLFWMYYLATILQFELPATTSEQKAVKECLEQYLKAPSQDVEKCISAINLM